MNGYEFVLKSYFGLIVPLFGGLLVVCVGYEIAELSMVVACVVGVLFGLFVRKAHPFLVVGPEKPPKPEKKTPESDDSEEEKAENLWPETMRLIALRTLLLAMVPATFFASLVLCEQYTQLPSLLAAPVLAFASQVPVLMLLAYKPPRPGVDKVLRGKSPGGIKERTR